MGARTKELSHFQKMLVFDKLAEPRISNIKLGKRYGVTSADIGKHLNQKKVQDFLHKCENDIYANIRLIREKAAVNWREYVKGEHGKDYQFEATKLTMKATLESPASVPMGDLEMPEFVDYQSFEDKEDAE